MNWSPFANHLWQSTVFAAGIALLALGFRRHGAALRYTLWLAASLKFLAPLAPLLALGARLESHAAPPSMATVVAQIGQPFAVPAGVHVAVTAPAPSLLPGLFVAAWFSGFAFVVWRWWRRSRVVRAALRSSSRLPIPGPVEVRSSPTRVEPGIFGVLRPVLLLPDGIAKRLSAAQFRAVLAHEFCHARRRDNLTAALHMVVEALFWFHPLVWWIGGRLISERERACDEEVVRGGCDPEDYAKGILNVCRFYLESPLSCAPGVTGADLKKRIEAIMTGRTLSNLNLAGKLVLGAAAITAAAVPIVIGIAQAQPPLRFEVASIKPVKNEGGRGGLDFLPGGGLRMGGATLDGLIAMAYDVRPEQIAGTQPWMRSQAFDILAKPEPPDAAAGRNMTPGTPAWERFRQRLRNLLSDRFQLTVHTESKPASVFALTVAKGGFKLQPLENADRIPAGTVRSRGQINGRAGTMQMLATVLTGLLQRPVEDRTGLTGRYTYKLEYAPDEAPADTDSVAPSIFAALQEQMGLKLEAARGELQTIVIDRAQRPSAN